MHIKTKRPTLCSMNLMFIVNFFRAFFPHSFPVFFHFCFVCKFPHTHFIIGTYWWQQLAKVFCCVRVFFCSVSIFNNTFSLEKLGQVFSGFSLKIPFKLPLSVEALQNRVELSNPIGAAFPRIFIVILLSYTFVFFLPSFIFAFCFDSALVSLVCRHAISQSERKALKKGTRNTVPR